MGQDEIKIRAVPRSNEKPKNSADQGSPAFLLRRPWWMYLAGFSALILVSTVVLLRPRPPIATAGHPTEEKRSVSAVDPGAESESRIGASISRHMTDAKIRQEMMMRRQELDNAKWRDDLEHEEGSAFADESGSPGPLMDHDKSAERVFEDLDLNSRNFTAISPHDKINARLANRKWLNEVERTERINFVRNFVRSAYDRGYEVQLNENLVVVGVRKLRKDRVVTIDQIMDRMAKQGY